MDTIDSIYNIDIIDTNNNNNNNNNNNLYWGYQLHQKWFTEGCLYTLYSCVDTLRQSPYLKNWNLLISFQYHPYLLSSNQFTVSYTLMSKITCRINEYTSKFILNHQAVLCTRAFLCIKAWLLSCHLYQLWNHKNRYSWITRILGR